MHPIQFLRFHLIHPIRSEVRKHRIKRMAKRSTPLEKSLQWIKANYVPGSGILVHSKTRQVTQEVTGYLIPTLYNAGERDLAIELARWEASVQGPEGKFVAPDGRPYTFDTAQVIRGFLAVLEELPELERPLKRACEYVYSQIDKDGRVLTPSYDAWKLSDGTIFSEYANLYVLPPLLQAGQRLSEPMYIEAAQRGMDYFRRKPDLVEFKPEMSTLSHIFGYMMEALIELSEFQLARKGLAHAAEIQRPDGAIPAYPGVKWVCSTGMAQLSVAWYKLGETEPADRAMAYLEKIQNPSGGFYGSYGNGARYFSREEISWAAKYFVDAYSMKIAQDFNSEVNIYSETIAKNDGRVQAILSFFGALNGKKVIDVGCGKGRYLRVLRELFPNTRFHGIDISERMLSFCPEGVETKVGSMLNTRYPSDWFDYVYTVEALEHAVKIESALKELVRILKPGGKIVIIDKSSQKLGALRIKPWERWFDPEQIINLLRKYGVEAHYKPVAYGQHSKPDGLFIVWEGIKNA